MKGRIIQVGVFLSCCSSFHLYFIPILTIPSRHCVVISIAHDLNRGSWKSEMMQTVSTVYQSAPTDSRYKGGLVVYMKFGFELVSRGGRQTGSHKTRLVYGVVGANKISQGYAPTALYRGRGSVSTNISSLRD